MQPSLFSPETNDATDQTLRLSRRVLRRHPRGPSLALRDLEPQGFRETRHPALRHHGCLRDHDAAGARPRLWKSRAVPVGDVADAPGRSAGYRRLGVQIQNLRVLLDEDELGQQRCLARHRILDAGQLRGVPARHGREPQAPQCRRGAGHHRAAPAAFKKARLRARAHRATGRGSLCGPVRALPAQRLGHLGIGEGQIRCTTRC